MSAFFHSHPLDLLFALLIRLVAMIWSFFFSKAMMHEKTKKKSIFADDGSATKQCSFNDGDFDEDESENNDKDDKEGKDPDEIAFLSSRDGERYNTTTTTKTTNKEENKTFHQ